MVWCGQRPSVFRGGIPAASLKRQLAASYSRCPMRLPRGIPAASLKQRGRRRSACARRVSLPRGIPAASLKRPAGAAPRRGGRASSAGNTRGLIEAAGVATSPCGSMCLPRGIPAASLKRRGAGAAPSGSAGLPRGIPAASLKRLRLIVLPRQSPPSSAGNTRGLIEAACWMTFARSCGCLPRGIPAASLKLLQRHALNENA